MNTFKKNACLGYKKNLFVPSSPKKKNTSPSDSSLWPLYPHTSISLQRPGTKTHPCGEPWKFGESIERNKDSLPGNSAGDLSGMVKT